MGDVLSWLLSCSSCFERSSAATLSSGLCFGLLTLPVTCVVLTGILVGRDVDSGEAGRLACGGEEEVDRFTCGGGEGTTSPLLVEPSVMFSQEESPPEDFEAGLYCFFFGDTVLLSRERKLSPVLRSFGS